MAESLCTGNRMMRMQPDASSSNSTCVGLQASVPSSGRHTGKAGAMKSSSAELRTVQSMQSVLVVGDGIGRVHLSAGLGHYWVVGVLYMGHNAQW